MRLIMCTSFRKYFNSFLVYLEKVMEEGERFLHKVSPQGNVLVYM